MRLEDTIRNRLFRITVPMWNSMQTGEFTIICRADRTKPVPLCMPRESLVNSDLAFRKLHLCVEPYLPAVHERSTPRAMYNLILGSYFSHELLVELKIKTAKYYYAPGVLFTSDKEVLFYFAKDIANGIVIPRLYITPLLLANAAASAKPMEKFFMSTIIPFLINNRINSGGGFEEKIIIEIDNHPERTFFMPQSTLVASTPVDAINTRLNSILADNSDVISTFIDNYVV